MFDLNWNSTIDRSDIVFLTTASWFVIRTVKVRKNFFRFFTVLLKNNVELWSTNTSILTEQRGRKQCYYFRYGKKQRQKSLNSYITRKRRNQCRRYWYTFRFFKQIFAVDVSNIFLSFREIRYKECCIILGNFGNIVYDVWNKCNLSVGVKRSLTNSTIFITWNRICITLCVGCRYICSLEVNINVEYRNVLWGEKNSRNVYKVDSINSRNGVVVLYHFK